MPELEELQRRLASLKKAAPWAKVEAAEELIENTVRVLIRMELQIIVLVDLLNTEGAIKSADFRAEYSFAKSEMEKLNGKS